MALASDRVVLTAGDFTTTSATLVDVTGATVTITTGAHRCLVSVSVSCHLSSTNNYVLDLDIDGVVQGQTLGLIVIKGTNTINNNASFSYLTAALTAASHTFKLQAFRQTTGTLTVFASTTVTPLVFAVQEINSP